MSHEAVSEGHLPVEPKVILPKRYHWLFLHSAGLFLSFLNKIRHAVAGYSSARPFSMEDIDRSVDYCFDVVSQWEDVLKGYSKEERPFYGRHVLEIGPGPDLGTGVIVLSKGAKSYCAIDKNEVVSQTPKEFYQRLFEKMGSSPGSEKAKRVFQEFQKRGTDRFRYIYDPHFDLRALESYKYEVLVTQAVLEHLNSVKETFAILRSKLTEDAVLVNEVDLSTHTRWIRELDPLNILRYSNRLYRVFSFNGSPNRLRIGDYRSILEGLGYRQIRMIPIKTLDSEYMGWVSKRLAREFRTCSLSELKVLSFYLLASMKEQGHPWKQPL